MVNDTPPGILVIGGANIDMTGRCHDRLIPGDSNPGIVRSNAGGVARNIAENLARLGLDCGLMSAVGADLGKQLIEASCRDAGVDIRQLITIDRASTGSYLAIHNQLGALLAAISDMGIIEEMTPNLLRSQLSQFSDYQTLVLDANLPQSTLEWIVEHSKGCTLMADAVSATKAVRLKRILPKIDLLKVNRDEAAAILDHSGDDRLLSKKLHEQGVRQVLLSQGPEGASLYSKEGYFHKGAIKGDNASDTGAGDALFAGFIAARHLVRRAENQLEFAIACATSALSSQAAVNPDLTVSLIRKAYLSHWPSDAWYSRPAMNGSALGPAPV